MLTRVRSLGLVALAALGAALAGTAKAVPTTYLIDVGPLSTLDTVQLHDISAPFTPTPCPPGTGNCLASPPASITGGQVTIDGNSLVSLTILLAGPVQLNLGGLNGYNTVTLVGISFQSQGAAALNGPDVDGFFSGSSSGIVNVAQVFLNPDPHFTVQGNPYVYSATTTPDVTISFGPNGLVIGVTGVDLGIFTDVNGRNPVEAKADFQIHATNPVPEPSAAVLFGFALATVGMTMRRRAAITC